MKTNQKKQSLTLLLLVLGLVSTGCGVTISKLSPEPTAPIPDGKYAFSMDPAVKDTLEIGNGVVIKDFRATLSGGFYNMMGTQATKEASDKPTALRIDQCDIRLENAGITNYLKASVRGQWLSPEGEKLFEFAGKVKSPDPLAGGETQLRGLVESIFESIMKEYNDELRDKRNADNRDTSSNEEAFGALR